MQMVRRAGDFRATIGTTTKKPSKQTAQGTKKRT